MYDEQKVNVTINHAESIDFPTILIVEHVFWTKYFQHKIS